MPATQKIIKILHTKRDTKKTLKTGKNEKRKILEKFNNVTTTVKFFTFIFCMWKRIYFARKHGLEKCSLYYYISSSKVFLVLQDI